MTASPSDSTLLHSFATTRNPAPFRQLVDRHLPSVHSAATRILRHTNPPLTRHADDIAQSVFILLAQNAAQAKIPADTPLVAWLYKVTHYACSNLQRIEQRRSRHEQEAAAMRPSTTTPPTLSDAEALLDPALQSLSTPDRTALLLRYTQNLSLEEIATLTKVPKETAKKRLHRALTKLRKYFASQGGGDLLSAAPLALHALTPPPIPHTLASAITTTALAPLTAAASKTTAHLIAKGVTHMLNLAQFVKAAAACLALLAAALSTALIVKASSPPTPPPSTSVTIAPPVAPASAPVQNSDDASLQELRTGIINRELRYESGHYDFTTSTYNSTATDKLIGNYHIDLFKSGPKFLYTQIPLLPDTKLGIQNSAWNGQIRSGYTHFPKAASPDNEYLGSISDKQAYGLKWEGIVKEKLFDGYMTILDIARKENCQLLGIKDIGNYHARGLLWTERDYEIEIWVAPENDFAPLQLILRHKIANQVAVTQTTDTTLIKIGDRWVTKSAKTLTTNPVISSNEQTETYELNRYEPSFPADMDFIVRFPVGTGVVDSVHKRAFIAGKFVEAKDTSDRIRYVDIKLFPEYDKLTDYSTGLSPAQWAQTEFSRGPIEQSLAALNTPQMLANNDVQARVGIAFGGAPQPLPLDASPSPTTTPPAATPLASSPPPRESASLLFLFAALAAACALAWLLTRRKKSPKF